jgi:hypothetical protein
MLNYQTLPNMEPLSHISLSQGVGRASDRARRASRTRRSRGRQWGFAPKKRGADGNAAAAPLCGGALEAVPRRLGTLRMWFLVKICLIFLEHLCFFCLNEFRRRYRGWYIMETIWNQGVLDDIRWSWWSISTATRLPFGHQTWLAGNPL